MKSKLEGPFFGFKEYNVCESFTSWIVNCDVLNEIKPSLSPNVGVWPNTETQCKAANDSHTKSFMT